MTPKNEYNIEGEVVWIKLTQGKETCIDLVDWEKVAGYRWYAAKSRQTFYAQTMLPGGARKILKLHRLLRPGCRLVDHEDRNGLNNRSSNLREATSQENARNARKRTVETSSQYKGVSRNYRDAGWYANIRIDGKLSYIGYFADEEKAARAYDVRAKAVFGAFAVLNFSGVAGASTRQ